MNRPRFCIRFFNMHAPRLGFLGRGITVGGMSLRLRAAAEGADVVFSMMAVDVASRLMGLGGRGAIAGARRGAILVESSTLTVECVREVTAAAYDVFQRAIAAGHGDKDVFSVVEPLRQPWR